MKKETTVINISDDYEESNKDHIDVIKEEITIFNINVSHLSPCLQFSIGTLGVLVFYIIYGYLQELIFLIPGFKHYGWYLTWFQFIVYTIMSYLESIMYGISFKTVPFKSYLNISFLTVATIGLSNTSVGYLNYPTQVIFKCCKLIPTMIGGIIIQNKKYALLDYISVFMLVIGLILFTLADSVTQPNFNLFGIMLISLALCADGGIGNFQENLMKKYNINNCEMVFYSYSIGTIIITFFLFATNTFVPAFKICAVDPIRIYGQFLIFSLTGYFGVQFILFLVKYFDALTAVTVSTCRKAVSIIISFTLFKKPFTMMYVYAGMIVLVGIYLNVYSKNSSKWQPKIKYYQTKIRLWLCRNKISNKSHSNTFPV